MSDVVQGILVGHGELADAMLDAVEEIAGTRGGIVTLNNRGLTPRALEERLKQLAGDGPSVVFVDLPSGSCALAARRLQFEHPQRTALVCGVNLPLLLDFLFNRELSLEELVERLRAHVGVSIEHPQRDADPSVPG